MGCSSSVVTPASSTPVAVSRPHDNNHSNGGKPEIAWISTPQSSVRISSRLVGGLTHQQKVILSENWKALACDITARGSEVFLKIFEKHPSIKLLFPCRNLTGEELVNNSYFRSHAYHFMQAVGTIMNRIDNYEEAITPLLNELGRKHIHFQGFKPTYFNVFQDAMTEVWMKELGEDFTAEAQDGWIQLFEFMRRELKRGYSNALVDGSAGSEVKREDID